MVISIYRYRDYILGGAWIKFRSRYASASLGLLWHVAQPLLMIIVYSVVFTLVFTPHWAGASEGNSFFFTLYLCSGYLPWVSLTDCVNNGTGSFQSNAAFLKKLPIPEQVFIAQEAALATFSLALSFLILIIASILLGHYPTVYWLALPAPLILLQVFGFGLGLFFGTLNVFFKDVEHAVVAALQVWFWLTPIVYPVGVVPDFARGLIELNPVYPYVTAIRDIFLSNRLPEAGTWVAMLVWSLVVPFMAYLVLRKLRPELRDNI